MEFNCEIKHNISRYRKNVSNTMGIKITHYGILGLHSIARRIIGLDWR